MLDELVKTKCEKALKSDGYVIVESNRLDEITNVHIESSVKETKCFVYYDGSRVKKIECSNGFMIRLGNGDLVRYHKIGEELAESIDYSDMYLGHTQCFMDEDMKVEDILELISSILSAETFEYNGEIYKDIMYFKEAIVSWNKYLIDCVREYGENGSLYLDTFEGWEEVYPCKEFMKAVEECGYYEMISEISRLLNNNNVDYVEYDIFDGILRIVEHVEEEVEEPTDTTVEAEPVEEISQEEKQVVKEHIKLAYDYIVGACENDVLDGYCSLEDFKKWLRNEALEEIYKSSLENEYYYGDYKEDVSEEMRSAPAEYIKSCIQELLNRDMSTLSANEIITDTEQEDDIIRFEVGKKYFHRNSNAVWECTDTPKIAINYAEGTFKTIGLGFKTTDNEYIAISLDNLHIVDGVEVISSTYNGELRADDIATITDKELVKSTMRELEKVNGHDVKRFIIGTLWVLIDLCISEEIEENCKQLIAYVDGLSECSSKTARHVAQELKELIAA